MPDLFNNAQKTLVVPALLCGKSNNSDLMPRFCRIDICQFGPGLLYFGINPMFL